MHLDSLSRHIINLTIKGDLRKFSDIGAWEVPSFDGPEPQPLLNSPSLDVSLGDVIGPKPPIKPHSLDSSKMKVVDYLTTQTPPSPHVANSYPKGIDISNWEIFDDDWGLESNEVSPLGEELGLFDRPNEVERGRLLEAHCLESILQQQISQRMALSHYDGFMQLFVQELTYGSKCRKFFIKTKFSFSQNVETVSQFSRDAVTTIPVTGSQKP
ncbi:hypothetical protein Tco_0625843 [Tanacetum coccineum]|uniref:Uncharacterized protein n=1 Tax=Tanacetum coccineum TaxID=301880 RepID=A0ABQ4WHZ5_9ASTR